MGSVLITLCLSGVKWWLLKIIMERIRILGSHSRIGLCHAFWVWSIYSPYSCKWLTKISSRLSVVGTDTCRYACSLVRAMHSVEFWKQCEEKRDPWKAGRSDMKVLGRWEGRPVVNLGEGKVIWRPELSLLFLFHWEWESLKLSWVTL